MGSYMDGCDWSICKECGECLIKCPVMNLDEDEAKREVGCLVRGEEAKKVFSDCTLCMNCNRYCPQGLMPYERIHQRITERKERQRIGLPYLYQWSLVGCGTDSFFQTLYKSLSPNELAIVRKWNEVPKKSDDVLFPGCFGKVFCYDIEHSNVFKDMPKYAPEDTCCGEFHYRGGLYNHYTQMADKFIKKMSQLKTKRLVCLCSAGYDFISNIMPNVYGRKLPFEVTSMYHYVLEKYKKGELKVVNPLNFTACIHDSCHSRRLGPDFYETLREVYRIAGAQIVELEHNRENGLCCGGAGMMKDYRVLSVIKAIKQGFAPKFREIKATGVNECITNCEGCYYSFSTAGRLLGGIKKTHYTREEVMWAFGDHISKPATSLNPQLLKIGVTKAPLVAKHVKPEDIPAIR